MQSFKQRWGIASNFQLTLIFIVFAITGSASAWLSKPVCQWLGITDADWGFWFTPVRLLLIFPIYQLLLVGIGFLFGQFNFFWNFEKKMLRSMRLGFLLPKEDPKKDS
ncbi:MAG: diacylglyceryl transferase [Burkholderiales bacterium]|nr:diacylglyceryl transferase [Flavobacterium sp.]